MRWRTAKKWAVVKSGHRHEMQRRVRGHQHDKANARASMSNTDWWRPYERPTWAEERRRLAEYAAWRASGLHSSAAVRAVYERREPPTSRPA